MVLTFGKRSSALSFHGHYLFSFPLLLWLPHGVGKAIIPGVGPITAVTCMPEMVGVSRTFAISVVKVACASVCAPVVKTLRWGSIGKKRILLFEFRWGHGKNG